MSARHFRVLEDCRNSLTERVYAFSVACLSPEVVDEEAILSDVIIEVLRAVRSLRVAGQDGRIVDVRAGVDEVE